MIEIKKSDDGTLLARRFDGEPLADADHECARAMAQDTDGEPRAWVVSEIRGDAGELRAVLICSAALETHLWVLLKPTFTPDDGLVQYYAAELRVLGEKSIETLRLIQALKTVFPGCQVVE